MLYTSIRDAKSMYTVKEVAEILGVSVHTVRYYDDQGWIPGTKRDYVFRQANHYKKHLSKNLCVTIYAM